MTDDPQHRGNQSDEMAAYLQTFLDETEEQLDDLVETMLSLERDPDNNEDLNEAFRLIHSIKGSAGMMGFDNISVLTHHLENRFERFRSGVEHLNEPTMNLVLRCIDFLRQCNNRLRAAEQLGSAAELLEELKQLQSEAATSPAESSPPTATTEPVEDVSRQESDRARSQRPAPPAQPEMDEGIVHVVVQFREGLQLADLKAQLIVTRLSRLGEIKSTHPDMQQLPELDSIQTFEIWIDSHAELDSLREAMDVEGVESISVGNEAVPALEAADVTEEHEADTVEEPVAPDSAQPNDGSDVTELTDENATVVPSPEPAIEHPSSQLTTSSERAPSKAKAPSPQSSGSDVVTSERATSKVAETMRVEVDRLDNLMNLTGELVVNRARFVQIAEQIRPELRQPSMLNRIRDFGDSLRRTIESLETLPNEGGEWSAQLQQLRDGIKLMEDQADIWTDGRHSIGQIGEAIDQLARVSQSLQSGVLDTRMVPVGPLFNRFKRVVRDLSKQRGKQVHLELHGEQTELDKRMIDELGDPLVHLVRNSIDHGLEPPDVRSERGKPAVGTISLEASHSGNSVNIVVRDDGGGIDVAKVRAKLVENEVLAESAADELSDEQALDYIWHPGFSTAKEVTDVSGRGVGMDVVKTRINQLNGTIEVESVPQLGTTFTLRLPLTLAIINSLLVRLRDVIFSLPIDDVREIVSVAERDIASVHGRNTFEVRDQYVPLIDIEDIFCWHDVHPHNDPTTGDQSDDSSADESQVVILVAGGKTLGLKVDELLGNQDVVVKSLADNFVEIRGLSGASVLGDGSVSLMLDVGTIIEMANQSSRNSTSRKKKND